MAGIFYRYVKLDKFCLEDTGVGERRIRREVIAKAMVDFIRVRMPE